MGLKQIEKALRAGKVVTYTIRRLRGYLHGDASLKLHPVDLVFGMAEVKRALRNFRLDERPYDKPRWEVST